MSGTIDKGLRRPAQIKTKEHEYLGQKVDLSGCKGFKQKEEECDTYQIRIESIHPDLTDTLCRIIAGALDEWGEEIGKAEGKAIESVKIEAEKKELDSKKKA